MIAVMHNDDSENGATQEQAQPDNVVMELKEEPKVLNNVSEAAFVSARSLLLSETKESFLSPGFRSVAASAGWDDEALLLASVVEESSSLADLIVEDSPVRERRKREVRTPGLAKTPASAQRRNRRARTQNIDPVDLVRVGALSLEDNLEVEWKDSKTAATKQPVQGNSIRVKTSLPRTGKNDQSSCQKDVQSQDRKAESTPERSKQGSSGPSESIMSKSEKGYLEPSETLPMKSQKGYSESSKTIPLKSEKGSSKTLETTKSKSEKRSSEPCETSLAKSEKGSSRPACLEQLREELSCAVCLDICFEPSTTSCGHSFCKMCLEKVIEKCGSRCPKCRQQLRGAFQACQINTVLWNTVQLLFPKEVEGRIKAKKERDETLKLERKKEKPNSYTSPANRGVRNNINNWHGHPTRGIGLSRPAYTSITANNFRRAFQLTTISTQGRQNLTPGSEESESEVVIVGTNERGVSRRNSSQEELDAELASRLQQEELMRSFRAGGGRRNRVQRAHHTASDHEREQTSTVSSAAANLRAMASRALRSRVRNQ